MDGRRKGLSSGLTGEPHVRKINDQDTTRSDELTLKKKLDLKRHMKELVFKLSSS